MISPWSTLSFNTWNATFSLLNYRKSETCPMLSRKRTFAHAVPSALYTLSPLPQPNLPLPCQFLLLLRSWLGYHLSWEVFPVFQALRNGPIWVLNQGTWVNVVFPQPWPIMAVVGITGQWAPWGTAILGEELGSAALLPKDSLSKSNWKGLTYYQ